jgi:hypothetical protein
MQPEVQLLRSFYCATVPTRQRDVRHLFFWYVLLNYLSTHTHMSLILPWFFFMATLYLHFSVVITNFRNRFMDTVLQSVISLHVLFNDIFSNSRDSAK